MSDIAEQCTEWMLNTVYTSNLFEDKVFEVYDPAILQELAAKLNYPVCGIVYEGIVAAGQNFDMGVSTGLSVSILILAESRAREVNQHVDKGEITTMLDTLRGLISRKVSPSNHPWQFILEIPMDLGDRGLVYYQKWTTEVII